MRQLADRILKLIEGKGLFVKECLRLHEQGGTLGINEGKAADGRDLMQSEWEMNEKESTRSRPDDHFEQMLRRVEELVNRRGQSGTLPAESQLSTAGRKEDGYIGCKVTYPIIYPFS